MTLEELVVNCQTDSKFAEMAMLCTAHDFATWRVEYSSEFYAAFAPAGDMMTVVLVRRESETVLPVFILPEAALDIAAIEKFAKEIWSALEAQVRIDFGKLHLSDIIAAMMKGTGVRNFDEEVPKTYDIGKGTADIKKWSPPVRKEDLN